MALPAALVLVALILTAPARPLGAEEIPAAKLADLTLKILTFDRHIKERVTGKIWVAIVASPSTRAAGELAQAFVERRASLVSGLGFEAVVVDPGDLVAAKGAARDRKLTCLVVFPATGLDVQAISAFARKNGVLSLTPGLGMVGPLSLGLNAEQGKIRMYRSDEALAAEKIQLAGDFLALTQAR